MRSVDGGASWTLTEEYGGEFVSCYWSIGLVQWHPTDPSRMFRAMSCDHSGGPSANLQQSHDQGATWGIVLNTGSFSQFPYRNPTPGPIPTPAPTATPTGHVEPAPPSGRLVASPQHLIGGAGTNASRFYMALGKDFRGGGSALLRTDDDGVTWSVLLDADGGGTATAANDPKPNIMISSIAYDPSSPDRVYAVSAEQVKGSPKTQTVRTSADAGVTWTDLGSPPVTELGDLVLGIDGANLYAATDQSVWRLHLR